MALTFTNTLGQSARVDHMAHGMQTKHLDMTTTTGSTGADYTTGGNGFPIQANASKMGFRKVYNVYGVYVRTSANAPVTSFAWYDVTTEKLRFFSTIAGAAPTEVTTDIPTNAIIRMIVQGV